MTEYTVGIDLGTTNSVVSYFENDSPSPNIEVLGIEQITSPGNTEKLDHLPSFLYQPLAQEIEGDKINDYAVSGLNGPWVSGAYARDRGAEVPGRFVSSAKSWLSQKGMNCRDDFLPFQSEDDLEKISPLKTSVRYLKHMANSWRKEKNCELADQSIILTVPASFDEEARKLTEEAARECGFTQFTILEEPLAALYAWVAREGDTWRKEVETGDVILVCDIGGGTSDFSLIQVEDEDGDLALKRTAVGEHILLGGDNMDLALAYQAKMKIEEKGKKLGAWQVRSLWFKARKLKETLLGSNQEEGQLTLLGSGTKLIGGTLKANFTKDEVNQFLLDGFFPKCNLEDKPAEAMATGLQEMGLPYAADAGVTRHLASFLMKQSESENFRWPNKVLFNGGVFTCELMRERVMEVLKSWMATKANSEVSELGHHSLDHAVSRGAGYFGWTRTGNGIRIRAGVSRSHYICIQSAMPAIPGMPPQQKAVCIVPYGMEEGQELRLEGEPFSLVTGRPARFQFLSSTIRQEDDLGKSLDQWDDDELEASSTMEVTLESDDAPGTVVPVQLGARVTDVGILELFFSHTDSERQWKLEYSVREG